jgi:hypothetical protein
VPSISKVAYMASRIEERTTPSAIIMNEARPLLGARAHPACSAPMVPAKAQYS